MKRMNVWIAVVGMAMAFSACKPGAKPNQETEETKVTEQKTGDDKDEHGCIASAGYVWSALKKDCIRPFEAGVKVPGITADNNTTAAYVVFAEDSTCAELFVATVKGGVLLDKAEAVWKNDSLDFVVKQDAGRWTITEKGTEVFAGE